MRQRWCCVPVWKTVVKVRMHNFCLSPLPMLFFDLFQRVALSACFPFYSLVFSIFFLFLNAQFNFIFYPTLRRPPSSLLSSPQCPQCLASLRECSVSLSASLLPSVLLYSHFFFLLPSLPPGVHAVVRFLTCTVALPVCLSSLALCGCINLSLFPSIAAFPTLFWPGLPLSLFLLFFYFPDLPFHFPCFFSLLPHLHSFFTFDSPTLIFVSPPSISTSFCLLVPVCSLCRSVCACTRCFNSMRFVLHYTVVCCRKPERVSPDVCICVYCICVTLAESTLCIFNFCGYMFDF